MLFNSYIFLLCFLPLCLAGFYTLKKFRLDTLSKLFLTGMSLWFYGYFNPWYLFIIVGSLVGNFLCAKLLLIVPKKIEGNHTGIISNRRLILIIAVILNLALLFYFKYVNFFTDNLNALFHTDIMIKKILLPLGISFFTFQQIGFIVDVYRHDLTEVSFADYGLFVTFFPQLIAGPIVSSTEMLPQFKTLMTKKVSGSDMSDAFIAFSLGLAKKVLIADTLSNVVDYGYTYLSFQNTASAICIMLAYTFQLYFDFSGYCDMALGLAKMFGITLPVNFNSPYKAISIIDFWKRWHITLNRFFTRYLYIPLGGNRKGLARTCINILIIYLLSGFWHGAGWNFIIWGLMHGILYVITRIIGSFLSHIKNRSDTGCSRNRIFLTKVSHFISCLLMFVFINVTWIFFRSSTLTQAKEFLKKLFSFQFGSVSDIAGLVTTDEIHYFMRLTRLDLLPGSQYLPLFGFAIMLFVITFLAPNTASITGIVNRESESSHGIQKNRFPVLTGIVMSLLVLYCLCSFAGVSSFLYYNF